MSIEDINKGRLDSRFEEVMQVYYRNVSELLPNQRIIFTNDLYDQFSILLKEMKPTKKKWDWKFWKGG